jgi:O-antigen ligase
MQARFFSIKDNDVDASANSRRASWAAAWAMAKDNPIFGVGIRNANLYSHDYGADVEGRTIHSQYLQTAADSGFVGLGLYLSVIASTFWNARCVRRAVAGRDDPEADRVRAVANGAEGGLATFCVGSAFLSLENFELPYLLVLLGAQAASMADDVRDGTAWGP